MGWGSRKSQQKDQNEVRLEQKCTPATGQVCAVAAHSLKMFAGKFAAPVRGEMVVFCLSKEVLSESIKETRVIEIQFLIQTLLAQPEVRTGLLRSAAGTGFARSRMLSGRLEVTHRFRSETTPIQLTFRLERGTQPKKSMGS